MSKTDTIESVIKEPENIKQIKQKTNNLIYGKAKDKKTSMTANNQ